MEAFSIIGVILAVSTGYLIIGWRTAKRDLPNAWARARKEWRYEDNIQDSVRAQTLGMVFCWPILLLGRSFKSALDKTLIASDPVEAQKKIKEQQREIDRLERELGLNRMENFDPEDPSGRRSWKS